MDMEEEDKNVFYSLLTKTAKEHLKNQICMYMYLFSFLAEEELAHQSWKSVWCKFLLWKVDINMFLKNERRIKRKKAIHSSASSQTKPTKKW